MLELMPLLDKRKADPLYMQLYTYIKTNSKGTIPPHEKLPSKRKLALHLSISQNTVEAAYVQLEAEGYIEILARKGAFVKEIKMKSCFKTASRLCLFTARRREINCH